jgi:hypothetical protein
VSTHHSTIGCESDGASPWKTVNDPQAVRKQLELVLSSFPFRSSHRCSAFLQSVVEEALAGRTNTLKERTLGIQIFERDPLYDTNVDPIVRVTAGEVRKRLAQYYCLPNHLNEIHINLPIGSYVPEFLAPNGDSAIAAATASSCPNKPATEAHLGTKEQPPKPTHERPSHVYRSGPPGVAYLAITFAFIVGLLLGVGHGYFRRSTAAAAPKSPLDVFWGPVLNSHATVLLCVGQVYAEQIALEPDSARNPTDLPIDIPTDLSRSFPAFIPQDAATLARVAAFLQSRSMRFTIHDAAETRFSNLATGPSVLIGAFNNDLDHSLDRSVAFSFRNGSPHEARVDRRPQQSG